MNSKRGIRNSRQAIPAALTTGPGVLWIAILLLTPLIAIAAISFMSRGVYGEIEGPFTLKNYQRFLGFGIFGFDPLYPIILVRSLVLGLTAALLCSMAG